MTTMLARAAGIATLATTLPFAAMAYQAHEPAASLWPAVAEANEGAHITVAPEELQWAPGPGSLPPGAEFVVIEGDPATAGPLTLRLKFPAGYQIPAHTPTRRSNMSPSSPAASASGRATCSTRPWGG